MGVMEAVQIDIDISSRLMSGAQSQLNAYIGGDIRVYLVLGYAEV